MLIEAQPLDFTVIGAPRCGAGWLASMLRDHPSVSVIAQPGPGFFADRHPFRPWRRYLEDSRALRRLFRAAPLDALLGEIAPLTYFDPLSASRQSNLCPDSRVIVLLRNPVDMLHSLYCFGYRWGWWRGSFEETLADHPPLIDLAFYDRLLTPWRDWFPGSQLHVVLSEQLFASDDLAMDGILGFLEVENEMLARHPSRNETRPLLRAGSGPAGCGPVLRRCRQAFSRGLDDATAIARRSIRSATRPSHAPTPDWPFADLSPATAGPPVARPAVAAATRLCLLDELDADMQRLEAAFGLDLTYWRTDQPGSVTLLPDNVVRLPLANRAMLPV